MLSGGALAGRAPHFSYHFYNKKDNPTACGTAVGGIAAPWFFGKLIDSGSRTELWYGYLIAAALMLGAALAKTLWGVAAEQTSLEKIAEPLSAAD
jgi:hypothetical protein